VWTAPEACTQTEAVLGQDIEGMGPCLTPRNPPQMMKIEDDGWKRKRVHLDDLRRFLISAIIH